MSYAYPSSPSPYAAPYANPYTSPYETPAPNYYPADPYSTMSAMPDYAGGGYYSPDVAGGRKKRHKRSGNFLQQHPALTSKMAKLTTLLGAIVGAGAGAWHGYNANPSLNNRFTSWFKGTEWYDKLKRAGLSGVVGLGVGAIAGWAGLQLVRLVLKLGGVETPPAMER
jgi:hypothetical protein